MENLLDYIVSETWAFMVVFIGLCLVPTLMIIKRPFKNFILARTTQITVSVLAFAAMMYLLMSDHGYAYTFVNALTNGKELCLVEKHYQGDGDGGSYEEYRLYVLDFETGKRKVRMNVETSDMLCVTENSVFFYEYSGTVWGAVEYSLEDGSELKKLNPEEGFEKFPEFKSGIMDMNRQSGNDRFKNEAWLTITSKDGHFYCYNLLTEELLPQQYPSSQSAAGFKMDEYELRYKDPADGKEWYFAFENATGEIERLFFRNKNYDTQNFEGDFLEPEFVAYNAQHRCFVIRHYETLEKKTALFSAVSFDLKPLWRTDQRKMAVTDRIEEDPEAGLAFAYMDKLILSFGGTVVCMNIADGNVIWKTTL